jgi:hypothetical protein
MTSPLDTLNFFKLQIPLFPAITQNPDTHKIISFSISTNMSDSLAILRQNRSDELAKLADAHMQNDLQPNDRDKLKAAASSVSLWTTVGSAVGVSLGLLAAIRLRSARKALFSAMRAQERPVKVIFEDGRTGTL